VRHPRLDLKPGSGSKLTHMAAYVLPDLPYDHGALDKLATARDKNDFG
jgi:hypothetical protein